MGRDRWNVTAHWANIDGRAVIVGIDIRGTQPTEVTQRVLRAIAISQIRDSTHPTPKPRDRQLAVPAITILTKAGHPRRRMTPASEGLLQEVAALYALAVRSGSKTPARFVEERLKTAGMPLSTTGSRAQVRKWIHRARERGLLPPT